MGSRGSFLNVSLLLLANALIPVSIYIFASGFFPYKPFLPGLAQYEDLGNSSPPPAPFDRLVFVVVDALRSDFVYAEGSGFTFTQSLIRDGEAIPFTANARSPTITMPRIKAMTTGSIPSFLDVILNFDEADQSSTLASQDTWLAQMKAKGTGKLVMYGDDTWLKLFPETFDRADGTTSFFVSDFTEVDNNVTRHIADELARSDWNTMVLHYLGLDHIGHKSGPRSHHMEHKQREMDGIISQIHAAMKKEKHLSSTLLVLCGDHGMNDAGNHGGSSLGETSAALLFISPKLKALGHKAAAPAQHQEDFQYHRTVEQSDLAPTLAALLGFPVPKNNLGAFITDFLPFWPKKNHQENILLHNARQILEIVKAAFGEQVFAETRETENCQNSGDQLQQLACDWQALGAGSPETNSDARMASEWPVLMGKWLRNAQELIGGMASNYDMPRLFLGLGLAVAASLTAIASTGYQISLFPMLSITGAYGAMMFGSSFVEEEHHFWYWSATLWLAAMGVRRLQSTRTPVPTLAWLLATLLVTRLLRGWNQTGQKHAGLPDIVTSFVLSNPRALWALVGGTYAYMFVQLMRSIRGVGLPVIMIWSTALIALAFGFKLRFTAEDSPELAEVVPQFIQVLFKKQTLNTRATVLFGSLFCSTVFSTYLVATKGSDGVSAVELIHYIFMVGEITQSRLTNIPLFLALEAQFTFLSDLNLSVPLITTSSVLLQYMSFFAFGGTNAISSVDLSSAYNGVSRYNVLAVGILTYVSNWAGPIYCVSATILLLLQRRKAGEKAVLVRHFAYLTLFAATSVAFVMAACTLLRAHLFIWTVFSPKYLYSMAWSIGQHLIVNIVLGGALYRLGIV